MKVDGPWIKEPPVGSSPPAETHSSPCITFLFIHLFIYLHLSLLFPFHHIIRHLSLVFIPPQKKQ